MADEETKKQLDAWGIDADTIERFRVNGITKDLLNDLTEDSIKELIPLVGPRIIFTKQLNASLPRKRRHEDPTDSDETESVSSSPENAENTPANDQDSRCDAQKLKRQRCFIGKKDYARALRPDVREILADNQRGQSIIKHFEGCPLSAEARNSIIEIVVDSLINQVKGRLGSDDFHDLARGIVDVFPCEDLNVYYVAPIKKKNSPINKSIGMRGKLIEKYRNRRQRDKRLVKDCATSTAIESCSEKSCTDEAVNESIQWLQKNREPWNLVESNWKVTSEIRKKQFTSMKGGSVQLCFKEWEILDHPMGWKLMQQDFEQWHFSDIENAINKWPEFFRHLLEICPLSGKSKISRVQELKEIISKDIADDSKAIAQLCLMAYLIPPRGRFRTGSGHWKPSMSECEESLVVHVKKSDYIYDSRDRRVKEMGDKKLTLQPYIVVVGQTLGSIEDYYVSLDNTLYAVPTALEAIDVCFKTFHVTAALYPEASTHLWYLIQRQIYGFTTKFDRPPPYILEKLTALNVFKESS